MRGMSDSRVGTNTKNWTFNAFCLPFEEFKSHFFFFGYNHASLHYSIKKLQQLSIMLCESQFFFFKKKKKKKKGIKRAHTQGRTTL